MNPPPSHGETKTWHILEIIAGVGGKSAHYLAQEAESTMALFAEPRMRAPRLAAGLNRLDVNLRLAGKFRVRALVTAGPRNASFSMVVPSREKPGDFLGAVPWPKAGLSWAVSGPVQTRAEQRGCAGSNLPVLSSAPAPR